METAAALEQTEPAAAPVVAAASEQAPIMTLCSYGGKLTREGVLAYRFGCVPFAMKHLESFISSREPGGAYEL